MAILSAWPAALTGASALTELRSAQVHLAVEHGRTVVVPPWARLHRTRGLEPRVRWHRSPPRVRDEHAILDVMSAKVSAGDVAGAFHDLTQVAYSRQITVDLVLSALAERPRLPGRAMIRAMLADLRDGACSVLERGFLQRVERAHGLPRAERQRVSRSTGRRTLQDLPYPEYKLIVGLDGGTYHAGHRSDEDAFRDLAELARSRQPTVRITYGLVFTHACRTARALAELLQQRGWNGSLRPCHHCRGTNGRTGVT